MWCAIGQMMFHQLKVLGPNMPPWKHAYSGLVGSLQSRMVKDIELRTNLIKCVASG